MRSTVQVAEAVVRDGFTWVPLVDRQGWVALRSSSSASESGMNATPNVETGTRRRGIKDVLILIAALAALFVVYEALARNRRARRYDAARD